ncbi:MAG: TonB family protein [Gemmatimonadaceae bacterium]
MQRLIALLAVGIAGVAHAQARPQIGGAGGAAVNADHAYFEFQVDRPVSQATNSARPVYPQPLKKLGLAGQVEARFVVDTLGVPDTASFKVVTSTHDLFTGAVRSALPNMRFVPAEVKKRKVKQLVSQRFTFAPPKSG